MMYDVWQGHKERGIFLFRELRCIPEPFLSRARHFFSDPGGSNIPMSIRVPAFVLGREGELMVCEGGWRQGGSEVGVNTEF